MTADQLVGVLEKQYTIKGAIDLADLSTTPQAAYQFFYSVYQTEFAPNDRIVLYSSRVIPEELLQHIRKVVDFVDISSWFVLICSSTSCDSTPFQNFQVNLDQTKQFETAYILPKTMCAIPWMYLEIRSNGDITPCCVSNDIIVGNIVTDSLNTAFASEQMQELRQQLLDGKKPKACSNCWQKEDLGLESMRLQNAKRLTQQFFSKYLAEPSITSIDIKFNNTCNFKCRICSPESSSLIAAEQRKFKNITIQPQANWGESDEFIDQVKENLPHLTNIDMYGGEPFLIKKFANLLKIAVEEGHAKNIRLHYNSNGSVWPKELIAYWQHFQEVDIHFSIDAVGKRFEFQRGGSWSEVENNILNFKNLKLDNLTINIMPTLSVMNVYYIDEVYDWAHGHGFNVFLNNLIEPDAFNLTQLTQTAQQLIVEKFKHHSNQDIQQLVKTIQSIVPADGQLFRERTQWFDSIRQECFADSHYEIAKAMHYSLQ